MTRDVTSSEGDQKFSVKAHFGLLENGFLSRSNHIVVFFIIGVLKLCSKFLDLKGLYIITAGSLKLPLPPYSQYIFRFRRTSTGTYKNMYFHKQLS